MVVGRLTLHGVVCMMFILCVAFLSIDILMNQNGKSPATRLQLFMGVGGIDEEGGKDEEKMPGRSRTAST